MKIISIETPVAATTNDDDDDNAQPPKVLENEEKQTTPEYINNHTTTTNTRQPVVRERKICCSIIVLGVMIGLSIVTINTFFYYAPSPYCYSSYTTTPITQSFDDDIDPYPSSFEPKIRSFDPTILSGYDICSDLIHDVEESGKYLINLAIKDNIYAPIAYSTTNHHSPRRWRSQPMMDATSEGKSTTSTSSAPKSNAKAEATDDTMSSYDTNNQVDDVDEADITKSDGTNVFLAYGNDVIWMRALTGDIVTRVTLPPIVDEYPQVSYWDTTTTDDDNDDDNMIEQHISSLLLDENQNELIVIVSYRSDHNFIFIERDMTASLVYDIRNDDELILKKTMLHRGRYETARLIDGNVHIVTVVDIYNYPLRELFHRYNYPDYMDNKHYRDEVYHRAELHLPQYARQLITELLSDPQHGNSSVKDDTCRSILALSDMITANRQHINSSNSNETTSTPLMDPTHGQGQLQSFIQTSSYNSNSTIPHIAGVFLPTTSINVYADDSSLVVAAQGWSRDSLTNRFDDETYLIQFELTHNDDNNNNNNVTSSKPIAVGTLPGYVLNQFSIDRHETYLRVATTTREVWECDESSRSYQLQRPSSSQITILEPPREGGWFVTTATVTNLGKNEEIYSVRFFRSKAFVVTFRQIDPFYTIDLSDPHHPFIAGELKIPGFSNYLHLIENDDYVLALGRDVDVETGRRGGVQISLFDVRDLSNPVQIHKTIVNDELGWLESEAQSDHLSFRYFSNRLIIPVVVRNGRYYRWGSWTYDFYYDGFYIYDVDITNGITAQGNVTHVDGRRSTNENWHRGRYWCWSRYYVPARSMVFEGRLMTMKGHLVKMSDGLNHPKEMWEINLDENRTTTNHDPDPECWSWFD